MITVGPVNMSPYIQDFLLSMRTFKTYSLGDFQIHNTILLTIVAMLYIASP